MKLSNEELAIRRLKSRIKKNVELLNKGTLDNSWLRDFITADQKQLHTMELANPKLTKGSKSYETK